MELMFGGLFLLNIVKIKSSKELGGAQMESLLLEGF